MDEVLFLRTLTSARQAIDATEINEVKQALYLLRDAIQQLGQHIIEMQEEDDGEEEVEDEEEE